MRLATLKLTKMPNFKNSHGLQGNYGSLLFASITLGAISIVSGFADYPFWCWRKGLFGLDHCGVFSILVCITKF